MPANKLCRCFLISLLSLVGAAMAQAQSAAEYGGMTAKTGSAGVAASRPGPKVTLPSPPSNAASTHMPVSTAASLAAANRLALEKLAGPDAAKLSLRSVPEHAQVWIDTRFVGVAPLDLLLAPGPHKVLMRAPNMEDAQQAVELSAKQTRQVSLSLKSRYPQQLGLAWPKRD
jgi:PEGA domain-containing protein